MSKTQPETETTVTTPDGKERTVVARTTTSRTTHKPVTDKDGKIVYYAPTDRDEPGTAKIVDKTHPDAQPRPECGLPTGKVEDVRWRDAPKSVGTHRSDCTYCTGDAERRSKGAGNLTPARRLLYGDEWGKE